jgi:hypothetical protein
VECVYQFAEAALIKYKNVFVAVKLIFRDLSEMALFILNNCQNYFNISSAVLFTSVGAIGNLNTVFFGALNSFLVCVKMLFSTKTTYELQTIIRLTRVVGLLRSCKCYYQMQAFRLDSGWKFRPPANIQSARFNWICNAQASYSMVKTGLTVKLKTVVCDVFY